MKIICVYDNHTKPNVFIKNIIGDKTFGEVILKRKSILSIFKDFIAREPDIGECLYLDYDWQIDSIIKKVRRCAYNSYVFTIGCDGSKSSTYYNGKSSLYFRKLSVDHKW